VLHLINELGESVVRQTADRVKGGSEFFYTFAEGVKKFASPCKSSLVVPPFPKGAPPSSGGV
jgi:hypothetical protein